MRKCIETLILIFVFMFSLSINIKAEDIVELNSLIENAKQLDGQEVTVQGEAIGERMDRGDYSWVNINDGTNAMGVWLSKADAEKISYYGNYKDKGDTVKITGTFNRACVEHGGEADLHNSSIIIVQEGYAVNEQISIVKIMITIILVAFASLSLLIYFKFSHKVFTTNK